MSSKINSKDIINKQKEKYADLPWNKFLSQEFDKPGFEIFLDKLINNVSKGIQFSPPLKEWFSDFQATSLDNLKVVIISTDYTYLSLLDKFNRESLAEQGVMFYSLARTTVKGVKQLEDWRMFNIYFIDYLLANKKDLVYVFVGVDASDYSEIINEEYGYKIFLPDTNNEVWLEHIDQIYSGFKTNVNQLLENKDIDTINW